jgi:T-complex protein 1 subunit gamma
MLKMLLDPMGGVLITNDGHAILREIDVAHPAAKSMIELSRTQDEEVGDGTTTVIILGTSPFGVTDNVAGEILAYALPHLERNIHPVVIIRAYKQALTDALEIAEEISQPVNIDSDKEMMKIISASIGTKMVARWSDLMCRLALDAVRTVATDSGGRREVDIKRYARIEKVPGGLVEDCRVHDGVLLNKDITHPKMRRRIEYILSRNQADLEILELFYWIVLWSIRRASHRRILRSPRKQTGTRFLRLKNSKSKPCVIKSSNSNLISSLRRKVFLVWSNMVYR